MSVQRLSFGLVPFEVIITYQTSAVAALTESPQEIRREGTLFYLDEPRTLVLVTINVRCEVSEGPDPDRGVRLRDVGHEELVWTLIRSLTYADNDVEVALEVSVPPKLQGRRWNCRLDDSIMSLLNPIGHV